MRDFVSASLYPFTTLSTPMIAPHDTQPQTSSLGYDMVVARTEVGVNNPKGIGDEYNQDAYWPNDASASPVEEPIDLLIRGRLYLVADGVSMGLDGREASQRAVESFTQRFYTELEQASSALTTDTLEWALRLAAQEADQVLLRSSEEERAAMQQRGETPSPRDYYQTTLVAALLRGRSLLIGNIGDSHLYRYRGKRLRLLNRGRPSNELFLGIRLRPEQVDVWEESLEPGDVFLLCTDGLYKYLPPGEARATEYLEQKFSQYHLSENLALARLGTDLVAIANDKGRGGGGDNITAMLIATPQSLNQQGNDPHFLTLIKEAWFESFPTPTERSAVFDEIVASCHRKSGSALTEEDQQRWTQRAAALESGSVQVAPEATVEDESLVAAMQALTLAITFDHVGNLETLDQIAEIFQKSPQDAKHCNAVSNALRAVLAAAATASTDDKRTVHGYVVGLMERLEHLPQADRRALTHAVAEFPSLNEIGRVENSAQPRTIQSVEATAPIRSSPPHSAASSSTRRGNFKPPSGYSARPVFASLPVTGPDDDDAMDMKKLSISPEEEYEASTGKDLAWVDPNASTDAAAATPDLYVPTSASNTLRNRVRAISISWFNVRRKVKTAWTLVVALLFIVMAWLAISSIPTWLSPTRGVTSSPSAEVSQNVPIALPTLTTSGAVAASAAGDPIRFLTAPELQLINPERRQSMQANLLVEIGVDPTAFGEEDPQSVEIELRAPTSFKLSASQPAAGEGETGDPGQQVLVQRTPLEGLDLSRITFRSSYQLDWPREREPYYEVIITVRLLNDQGREIWKLPTTAEQRASPVEARLSVEQVQVEGDSPFSIGDSAKLILNFSNTGLTYLDRIVLDSNQSTMNGIEFDHAVWETQLATVGILDPDQPDEKHSVALPIIVNTELPPDLALKLVFVGQAGTGAELETERAIVEVILDIYVAGTVISRTEECEEDCAPLLRPDAGVISTTNVAFDTLTIGTPLQVSDVSRAENRTWYYVEISETGQRGWLWSSHVEVPMHVADHLESFVTQR